MTSRLAYCTNVHPGEDLETVEANLDRHAVAIRDRACAAGERLGVGLWLAAPVAARLASDMRVAARLKKFLDARRLAVFTLNAFPYGGFHREVVKHAVYQPNWQEAPRLRYTLDCALALTRLLPEGEDRGTISTLPLGWRDEIPLERGARGLALAAEGLAALRDATGKHLRLLLEPEPGCIVETTDGALEALYAARAAGSGEAVAGHLGVCFDCCHQAVMGEDLPASLRKLRDAGVTVGKLHLSSALEGDVAALAAYDEPRYLHQVVACDGRGAARADDLAAVKADPAWTGRRARVHFHVPIHARTTADGLATTQDALASAIAEVRGWPATERPDLEVETYTWGVLPQPPEDLAEGIAAELRWAKERLA